MNACLSTVDDIGVSFINNDTNFKLSDGTPNDGYLRSDGIRLTFKGTNRLAKNIGLRTDPDIKNDNVVGSCTPRHAIRKTHDNNKHNTSGLPNTGETDWMTVENRRKDRNRNRQVEYNQDSSRDRTYHSRIGQCWNCGESNHISRNCRHDQKLTCRNFLGFGHKAKHCNS